MFLSGGRPSDPTVALHCRAGGGANRLSLEPVEQSLGGFVVRAPGNQVTGNGVRTFGGEVALWDGT